MEELVCPCVVINLSGHADERYKASVEDIANFEKQHGIIQPGSFVIFYTGWSRFWDEPGKYNNNLVFPSISAEAVRLLVERNVAGIGIDTLSPDCDEKGSFVHAIVLGINKYIVDNIANADKIPTRGSYAVVILLNVQGAPESPVTCVALCPSAK